MDPDAAGNHPGGTVGYEHAPDFETALEGTSDCIYRCHRWPVRAMAVGDGTRGIHADQLFLDVKTPLPAWIRQIQEFKPNMVIGYPSAIKILGELVEHGEVDIDIFRVVSCGEPLGGGLRNYLEETFEADVVNIYGASESLMWFEDSDGGRDFLHPLVIEGFCLDGLLDYQFCKLDENSFEMLAGQVEGPGDTRQKRPGA